MIRFFRLILFVIVIVSLSGCASLAADYQFQGALLEPALEVVDFTLSTPEGDFRLSDHQGQVVLIFFGYTNCPDFCPTTLTEFRQVHEALGDQADEVVFAFITIDPERDTAEHVLNYAQAFNPDFYGLSGSEEDLMPIWEAFWVVRERVDIGSASGYAYNHSTRVMVIDPAGNLQLMFPYGMQSDAMADDILHLLAQASE